MGAAVPRRRPQYRRVVNALRELHGPTMLDGHSEPFDVLIATILSQRSRDETTERVFRLLKARWPDAASLAAADVDEVDKAIHSIGFHRQKARGVVAAARALVERHGGSVPASREALMALPMVGPKTAGCVLVYAFGEATAIPVDTHVHRISNRLGWVRTSGPERTELELERRVPRDLWLDLNSLFVDHGKHVCLPRRPRCGECTVRRMCARVGVDGRSAKGGWER
jgi:endonuclease-3